jgi:sugar (pentulose or hexulose) kinase
MGSALLVPRVLEAGALGAAILAGVGVGVYAGVQAAAQELVQMAGRIEPGEVRHERYGRIYSIFLELEDRVAPLYSRLPVVQF